jgi:hypothetical protein
MTIDDLPDVLGRPRNTVVHLLQEHMWIKFTRKAELPNGDTLGLWASWSGDRRALRASVRTRKRNGPRSER